MVAFGDLRSGAALLRQLEGWLEKINGKTRGGAEPRQRLGRGNPLESPIPDHAPHHRTIFLLAPRLIIFPIGTTPRQFNPVTEAVTAGDLSTTVGVDVAERREVRNRNSRTCLESRVMIKEGNRGVRRVANPDISQTGKRPGVITAQVVGAKQSNVAETDARPSTECEQGSFLFAALGARQVVADFSGGQLSSDGGVLLLRELDRGLGLTRSVAACFTDRRAPDLIAHTVPELVAQRIFGLALGYEDLNDHQDLRHDPLLAAEFSYQTLETWSRARCGIGKAARLGDKDNPRFLVTTLTRRADELYEHVYC
jgi:hypothetical protein